MESAELNTKLPAGWHVGSSPPKSWRDVPGWFQDDDILDSLISRYGVSSVIEVGALFGRATAYFLSKPAITRVTVIDPFDGSYFYGDRPPGCDDMLHYYCRNLDALGHNSDRLRTYAKRSQDLASPPRADLIYLDGSHTYEDVLADLRKFGPLTNSIICGDDYEPSHPGVIQAVYEQLGHAPHLWLRTGVGVSDFWYWILT